MSAIEGEFDYAVVGAGILGLAVARELLNRDPGSKLAVLEREPEIAAHQTGHNSGVIHAGVYYTPGSLKAKLCVEGARELYEYCESNSIPFERCGKVIVALDEHERPGLEELERRGRENGVPGLRMLDAAGLAELEPHASGVAALHSPATGIVNFAAVAASLAADVESAGATVATGCGVESVTETGGVRLIHAQGELIARHAIFCCGAWSDRMAVLAGAPATPRIVPFRGGYSRLRRDRSSLVRSLIYPVPDPRLPFLGVHLTRHIDGSVLLGPSALMVGARDAYRATRVNARDLGTTLAWPGTWRMAARFWRTGVSELRLATSRRAFVRAAARYVPELRVGDVEPGPAGVRAQALDRRGKLVDDFVFSGTRRILHVRNAPSPGATSSLAIARLIVERAEQNFDLRG